MLRARAHLVQTERVFAGKPSVITISSKGHGYPSGRSKGPNINQVEYKPHRSFFPLTNKWAFLAADKGGSYKLEGKKKAEGVWPRRPANEEKVYLSAVLSSPCSHFFFLFCLLLPLSRQLFPLTHAQAYTYTIRKLHTCAPFPHSLFLSVGPHWIFAHFFLQDGLGCDVRVPRPSSLHI